jgi:hypothetical protein
LADGGKDRKPIQGLSIAGAFSYLEPSMKSEYRQAVESVIAQEAKLAEVTKLHADAAAREKQFSEALQLNQKALARYEARVSEIETQMAEKSESKV